jgi:hypothetical protein
MTHSRVARLDSLGEPSQLASRGLVNMGFRQPDVKRALDVLRERHEDARSIATASLIVEALAILT